MAAAAAWLAPCGGARAAVSACGSCFLPKGCWRAAAAHLAAWEEVQAGRAQGLARLGDPVDLEHQVGVHGADDDQRLLWAFGIAVARHRCARPHDTGSMLPGRVAARCWCRSFELRRRVDQRPHRRSRWRGVFPGTGLPSWIARVCGCRMSQCAASAATAADFEGQLRFPFFTPRLEPSKLPRQHTTPRSCCSCCGIHERQALGPRGSLAARPCLLACRMAGWFNSSTCHLDSPRRPWMALAPSPSTHRSLPSSPPCWRPAPLTGAQQQQQPPLQQQRRRPRDCSR